MYERFSDNARKVLADANREAQRLGLEYVGTETVLIALASLKECSAARILDMLGSNVREAAIQAALSHDHMKAAPEDGAADPAKRLPQTPRVKTTIAQAVEAAKQFGHNYVGTEHILLGLTMEKDTVAYDVLLALGIVAYEVRRLIRERDALAGDNHPGPRVEVQTVSRQTKVRVALLDAYVTLVRDLIAAGVSADVAATAAVGVVGKVDAQAWSVPMVTVES